LAPRYTCFAIESYEPRTELLELETALRTALQCGAQELDRACGAHVRGGSRSENRPAWGQALASRKIPRIRFHDLRHGHASYLLRLGVHSKVVSERLGHSTIGITLDTYSHVMPGIQGDAPRQLHDALSNCGPVAESTDAP
jgi:integrase